MRRTFISSCISTVLISLISISTVCADSYDAGSDFFEDSPMVLTVSKMDKPLSESPASVTVIDRQMIHDSGAREVVELFRMVPGFIVGYPEGNRPAVTYHGLGHHWHRQLQVLIDGRSVFIPSFGGIPWANLPLLVEDIERIEVTRGPNAVTYGANAFLATINIITRHAAEDIGSRVVMTNDIYRDSQIQDLYFRTGQQYGDLDWRVSVGSIRDDGYTIRKDDKSTEKITIRTDFTTHTNHFWTVQVGLNQSKIGNGDLLTNTETDIPREEEVSNSYQNIKWEHISDDSVTSVQVTHTRQSVDDHFTTAPFDLDLPPVLPVTTEINFDRFSERTDISIHQTRSLSEKLKVNFGLSSRNDKVRSIFLFNDDINHIVDSTQFYSSVQWKSANGFTLDLGVITEESDYTTRTTSSRLSIIQQIGNHHYRFVKSTASRNPILYELIGHTEFTVSTPFGDVSVPLWLANDDVEPEKIQSSELGLMSYFFDQQLYSDVKFYHYRLNDLITDNPGTSMENSTEVAKVEGIEFSLNYSPAMNRLRIYSGFNIISNVSGLSTDHQDSFPEKSGFAGGHYTINDSHEISAAIYFMDSLSWIDKGDDIESYKKLDLRYQYKFDRKKATKIEIVGTNLLGGFSDSDIENEHQQSLLLRISSRF